MKKKRKLGQNFLTDPEIATEILNISNITSNDLVLEIGPGRGILTEGLIRRAKELTVLEIDPVLCSGLKKRFDIFPSFHLIETDASKFDYSYLGPRYKVVSNLPYYAATHILKRLIHYRTRISDMTVMLQKEVVDRLTAQPGQKEYGSLSVFIQYYCKVERVLEIGKESFFPPPKIDSSVIKLIPLPQPKVKVINEKTFFKIVHAAFLHKRKMLKSNLKEWHKQFEVKEDKIKLARIDLTRRGETLSIQDFALISNHINSKSK